MIKKSHFYVIGLLLAVLATAISYSQIQASRFKIPAPEESFAIAAHEAPKSEVIMEQQTQFANGIEVTLTDVTTNSSYVSGTICYQLPASSNEDWIIADVHLTAGDIDIKDFKSVLAGWKYSGSETKTHRCDILSIPIKADMDLSTFTISIGKITTVAPEQPDCDAAQKKLDDASTGIKIECKHDYLMFGYDIVSKPASMSEYEARQIAAEAFVESVAGPWKFTFAKP